MYGAEYGTHPARDTFFDYSRPQSEDARSRKMVPNAFRSTAAAATIGMRACSSPSSVTTYEPTICPSYTGAVSDSASVTVRSMRPALPFSATNAPSEASRVSTVSHTPSLTGTGAVALFSSGVTSV